MSPRRRNFGTLEQKRLLNMIALVLVGAVVGYVLFWQLGKTEVKEEEERVEKKLLSLNDPSAVVRLTLTTPKTEFVAVKANGSWAITSPRQVRADDATIQGLIEHVAGLERERLVGEKTGRVVDPPQDLWRFALEPPRFRVKLEQENGTAHELLVGKKSAFDGSVYAKAAEAPAVVMVDGAITYQVDKELFALRDKRILHFTREDIVGLEVALGSGTDYAIERTDAGFYLRTPRHLPANEAQVTGILSALENSEAAKFLSETSNPEERARYGLDKPTARITLIDKGKDSQTILLRSVEVKGSRSHYAVRDEISAPVVELGTDWLTKKVMVSVETLRDRRVLRFDRDAVRSITLRKIDTDTALVFEKSWSEDKGRDSWALVHPEKLDVEDAILTGLLYRMWSLEGREINDAPTPEDFVETGLEPPELSIELRAADNEPIGTFLFSGKSDQHAERGFVTTDAKTQIAKVDASVVSEVSMSPDDYRIEN